MNIVFLIDKNLFVNYKKYSKPECNEAVTFEEILKIDETLIDKKTFSTIKALETHQEFLCEVKKARKDAGLPEGGYYWKDWEECLGEDHTLRDQIARLDLKIKIKKRFAKFMLPGFVAVQIWNIITSNCVYLPISEIHFETPNSILPIYDECAAIKIVFQKNVTKNKLIEFINDNWSIIKREMGSFPSTPAKKYITPRDKEIKELRERKKMTFKEIANYLCNKYPSVISEDHVKTIYHRTKNSVNSLFSND